MEPENLVIEQLKAIRASIEANGKGIEGLRGDMQANGERIEANTEALVTMSQRLSSVEEAIVGYTSQITMFSRSLTVQMEARSRVEDKLDDVVRRLEALEGER